MGKEEKVSFDLKEASGFLEEKLEFLREHFVYYIIFIAVLIVFLYLMLSLFTAS